MDTPNKGGYLFIITLVASLGGFLFGFDIAVVSGILPLLQKQFALTALQEGWFVSSALVGCIMGVAISGELSDRLGRKKPLLLAAFLFLLSALGCALMPSLTGIIGARIIGGIGIGLASNVVPLYISEIAPARIRGRLITYYQLALTLGILIAYLTNAALLNNALAHAGDNTAGWLHTILVTEAWRGMFGVGLMPALLFLFGLLFVPESPRWLIRQRRMQEATIILNRINNPIEVQASLQQVKQAGQEAKISYSALLAPQWRKALIIGILLPLFSQFSGINAIIYYGPRILNDAGISLENSLTSQIILGGANMLFTLIAIWKVDSLGRRPLYIAGTAGATISLLATGLCFYAGVTGVPLLVCVLAFLASFAFSIGPLKFVVAAEIFPSAIRGRAMAISIMVMWIADTIIGQLTPTFLRIGTAFTFWLFAFFCLIAFIAVYKLLPETKGKSLEQIEKDWKEQANNPVIIGH
jgi:MFS transporter, SP family, arabinose:H+ symporter